MTHYLESAGDGLPTLEEDNQTAIYRPGTEIQVTIENGKNLSEVFSLEGVSGMGVHLPPNWTAACLGMWVGMHKTGTMLPLYDDEAPATPIQIGTSAVTLTSSRAYTFPAKLFPWRWGQLWSQNGSGVNTNQTGGNKVITIVRKK